MKALIGLPFAIAYKRQGCQNSTIDEVASWPEGQHLHYATGANPLRSLLQEVASLITASLHHSLRQKLEECHDSPAQHNTNDMTLETP